MEEWMAKYLPGLMIFLFILCLIWVKKVNPNGGKNITYYSTKDLFRKEICPHCRRKMKKSWKKETFTPFDIKTKEFNASPIFICKECGYQINK